jgi:predicted HicB family RNase H-like nuclease
VRCRDSNCFYCRGDEAKPNSDQIIVRMPSELRDEIERKAEAEGRSLGNMTRRTLERALSSESTEAA